MKYKEIEEIIISKINGGSLAIGDKLPADHEIALEFGVSELTVNKALLHLAERGYLKRVKGKGTFVNSTVGDNLKDIMKHKSLSEEMRKRGYTPGSKLIEYKVLKASEVPEVAREMQLDGDELLHYFVRVRTADGVPVIMSYSYMPTKIIPYIDVNVLGSGSLWEFLGDKGFDGTRRAYFKVFVSYADELQARELEVEEGAPLLHSHHISVLANGLIFNYIDNIYVTDRYAYEYTTYAV